jgi:hypothetical protein
MLNEWILLAQDGDTTIRHVRTQLFKKLSAMLKEKKDVSASAVMLTSSTFIQLKSFLCCRNDKLTDDKELAFNETLIELSKLLEEEESLSLVAGPLRRSDDDDEGEGDDDEKGDSKKNRENDVTISLTK